MAFYLLLLFLLGILSYKPSNAANIKTFEFHVKYVNVTRFCNTKPLLTVNGQYPGPTIEVNEGDNVVVKVTNHVKDNTTLHWHGIRQFRTAWWDGPAYITQCPIQQGKTFTYRFKVEQQRGTLLWHAHISWQRASLHGAFIIRPKSPYPFPKPYSESTIILGEWWKEDVNAVEAEAIKYGGGPNVSAAYTINAQPGLLYPCSAKDSYLMKVEKSKTYMLRIINAALNDELFFGIEKHKLTVVEIDGVYTKPYETPAIMIAPGQTTNALISTDQSPAQYIMGAHPYATAEVPFDETTTTAVLSYVDSTAMQSMQTLTANDVKVLRQRARKYCTSADETTYFPIIRDTAFAANFTNSLRSINTREFPSVVPKRIDKRIFMTVGLNLQDCPKGEICKGYFGGRFSASINNQSFVRPSTAVLQAVFQNKTDGILSMDFPVKPPKEFNYTDALLQMNMNPGFGSKIGVIPFGSNVEMILQNTAIMGFENHPIHLHGYNFYVVGQGFGNYDEKKDASYFNLVDPPMRNTVAVPSAGWAVIRFKADNPGVWFMHCHLEVHTTWGLATAFVVQNGHGPMQSLVPPPDDLPPC